MTGPTSITSISLLQRIRRDEADPHAWEEFVNRYGRRIYEWCIHRRLQPADAEDVTQNVLLKMARRLGTFEYNPGMTFRGWLRRTTENAVIDFFRERQSRGGEPNQSDHLLNNEAARTDLAARLESAFDLELFEEAKNRVRRRVDERRWLAWEMIAVNNEAGDHVAAKLKMKLPSVYSSRYQIQKLIAEEVKHIDSETCDLAGKQQRNDPAT